MMTLPIDLVFVRHGESEGNLAKRRSEAGDHSAFTEEFRKRHTARFRLTEKGSHQAQQAGVWLQEEFGKTLPYFDRCLVSEYERAKETAGILALPHAEWYVDYNLRERESGDFHALTEDGRQKQLAEALRARDAEPFYWRPKNGESFADLCGRLRDTLDTLHRECSEMRVLIVCHGEVKW